MKIRSLSFLAGGLLALVSTVLLISCGGGGAQGNPAVTGALQITPSVGTIYAGIPFTFQVLGGRKPYAITSSEPALVPVPSEIDGNSFTVVAGNPGVIDVGQQPGQLPSRTTNFTVRSGDGQTANAKMDVGQNFLTGYGVRFTPLVCPVPIPTGTTNVGACSGGESAVQVAATFGGALFGDRQFRFEVLKGHFQFVFPGTGVLGNTVTTVSDHTGTVLATIRADGGIPTEIAVLRLIDVATGVYEDTAFIIQGNGGNGTLSPIPTSITLTGNLTTDCGVGQNNVLVFDGTPPYNALSSNPDIGVTPAQSTSNPGQFTITVNRSTPPCATGSIVVTDSTGARASIDVTSKPGSGTPPTPAAFTVAPTTLTLGCAQSGSVSAVGGSGAYSTNSTNPAITAVVSGNTITISRAGPAGAGVGTMTTTVSVTDGATIKTVDVTSPATCP